MEIDKYVSMVVAAIAQGCRAAKCPVPLECGFELRTDGDGNVSGAGGLLLKFNVWTAGISLENEKAHPPLGAMQSVETVVEAESAIDAGERSGSLRLDAASCSPS